MIYVLVALTIVLWLGIIYPEISSFETPYEKERRQIRESQSRDYQRQRNISVTQEMRQQLSSYEKTKHFS
jgi:hypothetical protein